MSVNLEKVKNLDISKVSASDPRVLDNGSKLVYLNYNSGKFTVQTPWMSLPWDMSCYTEGAYPKYSIDLSFKGYEDSKILGETLSKFKELDEKLIDIGLQKSVQFFKKKTNSREVIEGHYSSIIKYSKDKETGEIDNKYPPSIKVKIPYKDDNFDVQLYDENKVKYDLHDNDSDKKITDLLVKNTEARCILQCVGIWIASGSYMCQWKLLKAELKVPENKCEFMPDSDDEN